VAPLPAVRTNERTHTRPPSPTVHMSDVAVDCSPAPQAVRARPSQRRPSQ